jgi:hypothetical protein
LPVVSCKSFPAHVKLKSYPAVGFKREKYVTAGIDHKRPKQGARHGNGDESRPLNLKQVLESQG